ncbi:hypothetical protein [Bilifractor porci]|uniref:Uncharacterized protein n=1 Tax=Bilifractor porci TaxID=2606636 RepID=A0A7X2P853_9FIRM|nr:hypothetical protein [Bilifractor porci]MST81546.1 hypothetical protein [Bilifractor porci]
MSKFTEDEKIILRNLPKEYKYIARDKDGMIYVYDMLPTRLYSRFALKGIWRSLSVFENIFKGVTWENSPICFRDPQILDDKEREYLTAVLKPLPKVKTIKKVETPMINSEYLMVIFRNREIMSFPFFKLHAMYRGMEVGREYTLKELGLKL